MRAKLSYCPGIRLTYYNWTMHNAGGIDVEPTWVLRQFARIVYQKGSFT